MENIELATILRTGKNITILFSSHVIEFLNDFLDICVLLHEGNIIENKNIQDINSLETLFLNNLPQNVLEINL
jgi:ABC-type Na+ transport system ATPase subunit NatA